MHQQFQPKPASQDEIDFYCFIGEAVCSIQILEDALSTAITLKKNSLATLAEADSAYEKQRRYTLGRAVQLAENEALFPLHLQKELNDFYLRRNWLIHQGLVDHLKEQVSTATRNSLLKKIKDIANDAQAIQRKIEMDMVAFCQSKGRDMTNVLAALKEHDDKK